MFTWIASALGSAKVWVIGAVVALAGIAEAMARQWGGQARAALPALILDERADDYQDDR